MRPIPPKLRAEMAADPYYEVCCLTGLKKAPWVKIEWHHAFMYAGRQVNEKWCIVPLEKSFHARVHEPWIKEKIDRIILNRADEETLRRYSTTRDLIAYRDQLNAHHEDKKGDLVLQADQKRNHSSI